MTLFFDIFICFVFIPIPSNLRVDRTIAPERVLEPFAVEFREMSKWKNPNKKKNYSHKNPFIINLILEFLKKTDGDMCGGNNEKT